MRLRIAVRLSLIFAICILTLGASWPQTSVSVMKKQQTHLKSGSHMYRVVNVLPVSSQTLLTSSKISTTTTTTTLPPTTTTVPPTTTTKTTLPPPPVPVTQPVPVEQHVTYSQSSSEESNSAIWSCIISHESRGDPNAVNPSSGAGGLFQFLPSSWDAYGGTQYASLPEDATVSEQWDIAIHAQAESGWWPWKGDGCTPIG